MGTDEPAARNSASLQHTPDTNQMDSQMKPATMPPSSAATTSIDTTTTTAPTADIAAMTASAPAPQPNFLPNPPAPTIPPRTSSIQSSSSTINPGQGQIPPPPKANEMPQIHSEVQSQFPPGITPQQPNSQPHTDPQGYIMNPHQQHRQPHIQPHIQPQSSTQPHHQTHAIYQNLEHPPGYVQNPAVNAQNSHEDTAKPEHTLATLGMEGRWVWDPAPGEAGGRYVYQYDFARGDGGGRGGGASHHQHHHGGGGGHSNADTGDDGIWPDTGVWESTKSWMRTAGSKLVEAEEGVWKWVNRKT